jgi:hypothetical protein
MYSEGQWTAAASYLALRGQTILYRVTVEIGGFYSPPRPYIMPRDIM